MLYSKIDTIFHQSCITYIERVGIKKINKVRGYAYSDEPFEFPKVDVEIECL